MKEYESIGKKVDKLFREKSKEKAYKKNQENKNYNYEREKIEKQIMKLKAENKINDI